MTAQLWSTDSDRMDMMEPREVDGGQRGKWGAEGFEDSEWGRSLILLDQR